MNPEWNIKVERSSDIMKDSLVARSHTKIILTTEQRALPQPRQNYKSRFTNKNARRYNAWRKVIRDTLRVAWQSEAKGLINTYVKVSFEFGGIASAPTDARRNKDGSIDKRAVKSVLDYDLNNLVKSTEDICNGITWTDDRIIREYGYCKAVDTSKDFIKIVIEDSDGTTIFQPRENEPKKTNMPI